MVDFHNILLKFLSDNFPDIEFRIWENRAQTIWAYAKYRDGYIFYMSPNTTTAIYAPPLSNISRIAKNKFAGVNNLSLGAHGAELVCKIDLSAPDSLESLLKAISKMLENDMTAYYQIND